MATGQAIYDLKNETVFTSIQPYTPDATRTEVEHDQMHSSRPNSDVNYPHSYISTPVHEIPDDTNSKLVGNLGGLFAWDYALRFLLPDNVAGIIGK